MENCGVHRSVALGFGSAEQIGRLEFTEVDAVPRNAVKIHIDVNFVLAAQLYRAIDFF